MGACASDDYGLTSQQKARNRDMARELKKDKEEDEEVQKLLLLGAGESGKSTVFKNLRNQFGSCFDDAERKTFTATMHNNVINAMRQLCKYSAILSERGRESKNARLVACEVKGEDEKKLAQQILALRPLDDRVTEDINGWILRMWKDVGIRNTFAFRGSEFTLPDSAEYFFGRMQEVKLYDSSFIPTMQDVLRCRVRTTGILETKFESTASGNEDDTKRTTFHIFDVGGQRNERRKWMHLFEDVTAMFYISSLTGYSEKLYEDNSINRMHESLELYEELANKKWFRDTAMIIFLNKYDLFQHRLLEIPFTTCFPEFKCPPEIEEKKEESDEDWEAYLEAHIDHVKDLFIARTPERTTPHIHATNATNPENIGIIFRACYDIILKSSLAGAGLLNGS